MLNNHYQSELNHLRRLADEFARNNPALAPLLGVDSANDPDVERLLEGVAFLTGMVRQRLDDEFPEFIQELAQLLYPHYLQPLPCLTLLQFQPRGRYNKPRVSMPDAKSPRCLSMDSGCAFVALRR